MEAKDRIKDVQKLLYNYKAYKRILTDKARLLEEIRTYGLPSKSSSVSIYPTTTGDKKDEKELEDETIKTLEHQISQLTRHINQIDGAMELIENDEYFGIIKYKYFNKMTHAAIGRMFNIDPSGINRHDKRLLKELAKVIFA